MSPTKVGVVIDLIRGKNIKEAFAILQYTPKEAAVAINKVLKSAVANAENNHEIDTDKDYMLQKHMLVQVQHLRDSDQWITEKHLKFTREQVI